MKKLIFSLLVMFFAVASVSFDTVDPKKAVYDIYFQKKSQGFQLAKTLDVWNVNSDKKYITALISEAERHRLSSTYRIVKNKKESQEYFRITQQSLEVAQEAGVLSHLFADRIPRYECYRTVEKTFSDLEALTKEYPDLVSMHQIGASWKREKSFFEGYNLRAFVVTDHRVQGPKAKLFIEAAIHARELATAETAARLVETLVSEYKKSPELRYLLKTHEVHVIPVSNPDGRKIAEQIKLKRKNVNNSNGGAKCGELNAGIDLNRNFGSGWRPDPGGFQGGVLRSDLSRRKSRIRARNPGHCELCQGSFK